MAANADVSMTITEAGRAGPIPRRRRHPVDPESGPAGTTLGALPKAVVCIACRRDGASATAAIESNVATPFVGGVTVRGAHPVETGAWPARDATSLAYYGPQPKLVRRMGRAILKVARSALRITLALWERAGVRETVMGAAPFIFWRGGGAVSVGNGHLSGRDQAVTGCRCGA